MPRNCEITKSLLRRDRKARQSRIEELCMNQERNPNVVNQLVIPIQELQNKVNSLTDARDCHDPEGSSSFGASSF